MDDQGGSTRVCNTSESIMNKFSASFIYFIAYEMISIMTYTVLATLGLLNL